MTPIRRAVLGITGLVAVGLLSGCTTGTGGVVNLVGDDQRAETTVQDAGAVAEVEIDADVGQVRVRSGAAGASRVERTLHWREGTPEPAVTQAVDGRTLRISAHCPQGSENCATDLTVTVPPAAASTVRLAAGGITVDGLHGEQDLRNTAGPVRATGLGPAPVTAVSRIGPVEVELAEPAPTVSVATTTGDARVRVPRGSAYHVRTSIGLGDATSSVPDEPGAGHVVDARSKLGAVGVDFG